MEDEKKQPLPEGNDYWNEGNWREAINEKSEDKSKPL